MKQFLITVAGVFVGLALFMIGVPLLIFWVVSSSMQPARLAARNVLVLDLRGGLTDQETQNPIALLQGKSLSVLGVEETLRRAGGDDRIKGLFVRLPEAGMAPAAADELRLAFRRFRATGKPILVHSQGFYPGGPVASTYELAAASGDIWMQPASSFQVTGFAREDAFFKRFFDRYGVVPDFQQRYEYKTAVNPFLYSDYTPAQRQSDLSWMGSVYGSAIASASADRATPAATIKTLIESGPWSAEDARSKGLIDAVGQVKDAQNAILAKAGQGAALLEFGDYAARGGPLPRSDVDGPTIAVILAEGNILTGRGASPTPLGATQAIRSDDVAKAFYDAIKDDDVRAIVFRISSPGGSDTASEQILSAVRAARAAGKPVVVSMGTYGASGGYWVSSQASEIIAEPSTLTGSIGVFGGKFALGPALARFGVDLRGVSVGSDYAQAFSSGEPMTPTQKASFAAEIDRIYEGFVSRVAEGRRIPLDRVREIARGRVWTGEQAKALGLVDELGGFYEAVGRAKALAGIKGPAHLQSFNVRTSPLETLQRLIGVDGDSARILAGATMLLRDPAAQSLLVDLGDARQRQTGALVLAPRLVR
jgi:protease IV